jgi:hypothetical protein
MSIGKMGLRAGLVLGGGLMLSGVFVMSFASSAPGGGLMIVLGLLFFVPGAFIAGSAFIAWLSVRLYGSLDDSAKRKVKWGVLVILPVAWFAWSAVQSYLYFRPSAVAEREMAAAQRALVEEEFRKKFEAANEFLVGAWQEATQPGHVIMFDNKGRTYRTDGGEIHQYESWHLALKSRDSSSVVELKFYGKHGTTVYEILQVDDAKLVTKTLVTPGDASIEPGFETQSFSRIADAATLRKFYPRAGSIIMQLVQPGAQTLFVNGVAHRFFDEPVAVSTYGGVVRSGPGLEHSKATSMYKGDPVALIAVTEAEMNGFKWFQIRYRDGLDGYALGGLLCPKEVSIEGIQEHC